MDWGIVSVQKPGLGMTIGAAFGLENLKVLSQSLALTVSPTDFLNSSGDSNHIFGSPFGRFGYFSL